MSKYWLLNYLCNITEVSPLNISLLQHAIRFYLADLGESLHVAFPYNSKSKFIYRARLNENFVFEKKGDLFCPPVSQTKLGRANFPNQPIFYCAENPDVTIAEIKIPNKDCFVTVGQYRIKMGVELSLKSLGLQKTDRYNISGASNDLVEFERGLMELFTKNANDETETALYSKTAAISNTVLEENSYHGIIYPSIQTEYKGDCIAIRPQIIEQHFELTEVKLFEVKIDPETRKSLFRERLYAVDFDDDKIKWKLKE